MYGRTDDKSPHSIGLRPLPGPLPKKKFLGPKPLPPIIDLARDQPLFVPPVKNQSAKPREVRDLDVATQRERASQDETARLRKQIKDMNLKQDDEKQQHIASWAASEDTRRQQELEENKEKKERARVD